MDNEDSDQTVWISLIGTSEGRFCHVVAHMIVNAYSDHPTHYCFYCQLIHSTVSKDSVSRQQKSWAQLFKASLA